MTRLFDLDTKKYPIVHCKSCGHSEQAHFNEETVKTMVDNSWCFTCMCWSETQERAAKAQEEYAEGKWPSTIVVRDDSGPMVYFVGSELPKTHGFGRGYGGSSFVILLDDGRQMCSSNLWSGQTIPELRRDSPAFKPMGEMLRFMGLLDSQKAYTRLLREGCYYHTLSAEDEAKERAEMAERGYFGKGK